MSTSINNTGYSDLEFLRLSLSDIETKLCLYNGKANSLFYSEGIAIIVRVLNVLGDHIQEMQKEGKDAEITSTQ